MWRDHCDACGLILHIYYAPMSEPSSVPTLSASVSTQPGEQQCTPCPRIGDSCWEREKLARRRDRERISHGRKQHSMQRPGEEQPTAWEILSVAAWASLDLLGLFPHLEQAGYYLLWRSARVCSSFPTTDYNLGQPWSTQCCLNKVPKGQRRSFPEDLPH